MQVFVGSSTLPCSNSGGPFRDLNSGKLRNLGFDLEKSFKVSPCEAEMGLSKVEGCSGRRPWNGLSERSCSGVKGFNLDFRCGD